MGGTQKRRGALYALTWTAVCAAAACMCSCCGEQEYTEAQIQALREQETARLVERTINKPWRGEAFAANQQGGVWYDVISADPKSFNLLIAEQDSATAGIISGLHEYLVDYDYAKKEWVPQCAFFDIKVNEQEQTVSVYYTLRDNLYWSFYGSDTKIPVTSDDVVFWYNEIEGDPAFHSSAYNSQFVTLENGETAHIDIEKIDEKTFAFHFPRMDANPLLSTNRTFGPSFIYRKAKETGGVQAVLDTFSVACDVRSIPSMGRWFIKEYTPGLRVVFARNPDYWEHDADGGMLPYPDEMICTIIPDPNTQYLLFKQGSIESTAFRPEELDSAVQDSSASAEGYTVYGAEGSLVVPFWSFNQNPVNRDKPYYTWFTTKEFRQAMSCLLDRDRIITQTYRGLASPKYDFFASANPYYNEEIQLEYRCDAARAVTLLESAGFARDPEGVMRDSAGNAVEFDLSIQADTGILTDMASIIAESCAQVGIRINIRQVDFQKLVQQLTSSYDWQSVFIGLGANYWPTQGSNVWPSNGNLHLWYPLQQTPATEWEARIDYLYNEGSAAADPAYAQTVWDEYQRIILEQCPVIYLVSSQSFVGVRNRWDSRNIYYDNVGGLQTEYVGLRQF